MQVRPSQVPLLPVLSVRLRDARPLPHRLVKRRALALATSSVAAVAATALLLGASAAAAAEPPAKAPAKAPPAKSRPAESAAPSKMKTEVPILGLSSEDAEDQAEALTGALRSRARLAPGVIVDETTVNLGTLMNGLSCGQQPDPLCLIKIGEQLKVDRFVWGQLRKGPDRGQVTADVHLWRRGKPDTVASESFSDNLRDQNDDVLRRIAGRLSDRLFGQPVAAPVTVRVGDLTGELVVDGGEAVAIVRGEATVELRPGRHTIKVTADGYETLTREVDVSSTAEQVLTLKLAAVGETKAPEPSAPISTRTVVALGFIGVGVGFGIAGTVKAAEFLTLKDENRRDHETLRGDFCSPQGVPQSDVAALDAACKRVERGENVRLLELVFYGVAAATAGTGLVLLVTDSGDKGQSDGGKASARRRLPVSPRIGKGGGSLDLTLPF